MKNIHKMFIAPPYLVYHYITPISDTVCFQKSILHTGFQLISIQDKAIVLKMKEPKVSLSSCCHSQSCRDTRMPP